MQRWLARELALRQSNLIGFWPFLSNTKDYTWHGNHARTIFDFTSQTSDRTRPHISSLYGRNCFYQNLAGGAEFTDKDAIFNFVNTPVTCSFWFCRSTYNTTIGILSKGHISVGNTGWEIGQLNSGLIYIVFYSSTNGHLVQVSTQTYNIVGEWLHVVITHDGSYLAKGLKIYINGVQQPVAITADNYTGTPPAPTDLMRLGATISGPDSGDIFGVSLLRLYNSVLPQKNIADLYRREREVGMRWRPGFRAKFVPNFTNNIPLFLTGAGAPVSMTQEAVEVLHSNANQTGRVTQEAIEVLHTAATRRGRVTQETLEVLHSNANRTGRITQESLESVHHTLAVPQTSGVLNPNDYIYWQISTTNTVNNNVPFTASGSTLVQGTSAGQFNGNFNAGETLFQAPSGQSVTITFGSGYSVKSIGAQIQPLGTGIFFASVYVYDVNNIFLGQSSISGTMNSAGDGSAPFVGVYNQNQWIHKAVFMVNKMTGQPNSTATINYARILDPQVYTNSFPLFMTAAGVNTSNIPLYMTSFDSSTSDIPLYIAGPSFIDNPSIPLFLENNQFATSIPLYMAADANINTNITLYTNGDLAINSGVPLYTYGSFLTNRQLNLFAKVDGYLGNPAASIPLTINSLNHQSASGIPLFISVPGTLVGGQTFTDSITLYLNMGPGNYTDCTRPLYMKVTETQTINNMPLYLDSSLSVNNHITLFIPNGQASGTIKLPMYINGF